MGNLFALFGGLAFIWLLIIIPIVLWIVASLQKTAILYISSKFLGFELAGGILKSCVIGLIGGVIASEIVAQFGGELLSLAAFLFSSWPLLFIWTKKKDNESSPLTHKEAAILSASSSFSALVLLFVIGYIISYAIALGVFSLFVMR